MSRILLCRLNGAGKSTLGKALAEKVGYVWLDVETYYFPQSCANNPYANPRTQEEVCDLPLADLRKYPNVILSAVRANYSADIVSLLELAVYISVPKEIRMERIRNRAFQKFGARILSGGDLYEQEQAFFHMAEKREDIDITNWLETLQIPTFTLDGTLSIDELLIHLDSIIEAKNAGA